MKGKKLHGRKIKKRLSVILAAVMVFIMMPLTEMTVYADGASITYESGTVDVTTLRVNDKVYKGVTLINDKDIVRCNTCHQIWIADRADALSVDLKKQPEHSGHASSVGWSGFN